MKNTIFISIYFMLFSCSNSIKEEEKNIIPSKDMIEILTNRQLIVSEFNTFQYQGSFTEFHVDSLLSSTYQQLGYSDDDFKMSWDYYTTKENQELLLIYDKVLQELQQLEVQSKN